MDSLLGGECIDSRAATMQVASPTDHTWEGHHELETKWAGVSVPRSERTWTRPARRRVCWRPTA